jgi:IS30 family transposase
MRRVLVGNPHSRIDWTQTVVATKLALDWSPEQISGWLEQRYRGGETMRVSHETITAACLSSANCLVIYDPGA